MHPWQAIRYHIATVIQEDLLDEVRLEQLAQEKEAQGYRIVDGGQTSGDEWEVTDWRTGKVLLSGVGWDKYEEAERAAGDPWWHIDNLGWEAYSPLPPPPDEIPRSLATALEDWASSHPDEAALLLEETKPPDS